jgi:uncharacterized protein (TIGR02271 family)
MPTKTEVTDWRGLDMVDSSGSKVGRIEDIYLDAETDQPEWAFVHTGLFGSRSSFVPIANASSDGRSVRVPFKKSQVKDAPNAEADGQLSQDEEARLYRHYGMDYSEARSDTGLPEGGAPARGTSAGDSVTRSEEELSISKERRGAGTARLRKYVETEHVDRTVPVEHERARVTRETLSPGESTDAETIGEREIEVDLTEDVVDVDKRTVAKERVSLGKETVTEEREVSEELRKERVEVDGDVEGDRR